MLRTTSTRESLQLLRDLGLSVGDVLDVGVQTGTPALVEVFPDRTHHLFEPVDDYFAAIERNYASIAHHLVHAAVSDAEGVVHLHSARKLGNAVISHSWITDAPSESTREVAAITLDHYLGRAAATGPYLLKVDVEGAAVPAAILRGAAQTLQQCAIVVIEMTVERFFERAALLEAAGFDLWDLTSLCYYGDCLWQFDAVYVRREDKRRLPALSPMHVQPFRREAWQQG